MTARMLDERSFANASRFLVEQARPLEAARFRFHFEEGSRDSVLAGLGAYQNEDGGFGNALEPDLRAPESSAIATSLAFQVLRELGAVQDRRLAGRALRYLLETFDRETGGWRIVPPSTDARPHAPWWQQAGRDHDYDDFGLNPNTELLGVLYERRAAVPPETLEAVTRAVLGRLTVPGDLEMHDLLCCLRLDRTPDLPDELARAVRAKIDDSLPGGVGRDREAWASYSLRPLQVVRSPTSPFLPGFEDAVELNLDYEIETQQPDGSWIPPWTWGDAWPDVWPVARREWSGVLTLRNLRTLRTFGRIEGR